MNYILDAISSHITEPSGDGGCARIMGYFRATPRRADIVSLSAEPRLNISPATIFMIMFLLHDLSIDLFRKLNFIE